MTDDKVKALLERMANECSVDMVLWDQFSNAVLALQAERDKLSNRNKTLEHACSKANDEVSQTLGKALGYPWFKDDQKNFPDATEADGVCVGEHVAESLAEEAARRIDKLSAEVERLTAEFHRRGISIIGMSEYAGAHLCRAEAAEAKLTALVEVDFRAIALDCLERQRQSGESKEMVARWIGDALHQALAHHSAPVGREHEFTRCACIEDDHEPGCTGGYYKAPAPSTTPTSAPVEDVGGLLRKHMEASGTCVWDREPDGEGTDWCGYLSYAERDAFLAGLSPSLIQPADPTEGCPISSDGPHAITEHRRWLARQLLDSKLDDAEAFGIVRHFPAITDLIQPQGEERS